MDSKYTKIIVGVLILFISSSVIYINLQGKAQMRIDNDRTTFYINDSGFKITGREYNRLFDGSTQLYRDLSSIKLLYDNSSLSEGFIIITRQTTYKRGPTVLETYKYSTIDDNIFNFPIEHRINIINGSGYFYRYSIDNLRTDQAKEKIIDLITLNLGDNMKVDFQTGYRWAWKGWPYGLDSFSAQYDISSDNETFIMRLYDPPLLGYDELDVVKKIDITVISKVVCVDRLIYNPTFLDIELKDVTLLSKEETIVKDCNPIKYLLDPYVLDSKLDVLGLADISVIKQTIPTQRFYLKDTGLIYNE